MTEQAGRFTKKELDKSGSPLDALGQKLDRIRKFDPWINAVSFLDGNAARQNALALDQFKGTGKTMGLAGKTVLVKDCIAVKNMPMTAGSAFFSHYQPKTDADVVRNIRNAGAVVIGKSNMHEFAFGGTNQNGYLGNCYNPWDITRVPGGSSGGAAAAVAAGFSDMAIGTDTGSSIRMPAALCGVCGLRPSRGSVSVSGVFPVSGRLDTVGPIARHISDIQLLLEGMNTSVSLAPIDKNQKSLVGITVGVLEVDYLTDADTGVALVVKQALKKLETAGAKLKTIKIEGALECRQHVQVIIFADAAKLHAARMKISPELFGPEVLARLKVGALISQKAYQSALVALDAWHIKANSFLETECDLFASPTVPIIAPKAHSTGNMTEITNRLADFCWGWAGANIPALTLPCGFHSGMPVGLQLASRHNAEQVLLRVGAVFQRVTDWHNATPEFLNIGLGSEESEPFFEPSFKGETK